ncbi:MAG: flagellar hook capping protein [Candidatus Eremiobacteraeota bacterium]|nr:flagellar hook capping protein [Candidatus Eremiobacteraeota bacterium]
MSNATSATGLPINSLINNNGGNSLNAPAIQAQLGQDAFLKLLTTELRNQDPEKPMDSTQSIAQLAQFSALQAQTSLSNAFASFQSNFGVMQAASLIGKTATVNAPNAGGNSSSISGTIKAVNVMEGKPYFTMTDKAGNVITDSRGVPEQFSTSQITSIGN